jgi:thioredoxin-related protein
MLNVILVVFLVSQSCASTQDPNEIIYFTNCNELEAEIDVKRSIDFLAEDFKKLEILVSENTDSTFCGYLFKNAKTTKVYKGAMTDYDLAVEAESFFDIKILVD